MDGGSVTISNLRDIEDILKTLYKLQSLFNTLSSNPQAKEGKNV